MNTEIKVMGSRGKPSQKGDRINTLVHWARRLLVCNPFYLASAALLLYGLFRLSTDPASWVLLQEEATQLALNFTALQAYELLLVVTAVLLARRRIYYDAKLLVTLENLLLFVPFALINQAALIDQRTVGLYCGVAGLFAAGRSVLAQRSVPDLRFPPRLVLTGMVVLVVNLAWPVIYRFFQETKLGKNLESGAAFEMHVVSWLLLLPALIALVNLLPGPREGGKSLVQCPRFPVALFGLWLLGTVMNLCSLGYVYDFSLHCEWLAPGLWVLAWSVYFRLPDYVVRLPRGAGSLTLMLPFVATLLATNENGVDICFWLNAINLVAYAGVRWRERGHQPAMHCALLSLAAMIAALPAWMLPVLPTQMSRSDLVVAAILFYVLVAVLLSRNPKSALGGALAAAIAAGACRGHEEDAWHWAAQAGVVFLLLHSLRWRDHEHPGANGLRVFMAGGWWLHSLLWIYDGADAWQPMAFAGLVLLVCWSRASLFVRWSPQVVPGAALGIAFSSPVNLAVQTVHNTPTGIIAVMVSLMLFVAGTALAVSKQHWHRPG